MAVVQDMPAIQDMPAVQDIAGGPVQDMAVLHQAHAHAAAFFAGLPDRRVSPNVTAATLRARWAGPLPEQGSDPAAVLDRLVAEVDDGLLASTSGRFFGWVIGGTLPVAIAADWLTAAWDQNAASYSLSPAASVLEEVCGAWLIELLGLPADASFALVTGTQMGHATALAAARHRLLADRGIDVERDGLSGAPRLRVLAGEHGHQSILRALRLLGIGTGALQTVGCDPAGAISLDALRAALATDAPPTIVCLQAGDVHTGAYDAFAPACAMAHAAGALVHVDGAFGLWAAASGRAHLLRGVEQADSWTTDGHKWLNLPHDTGFVFVADPAAHRAAFAQPTQFGVLAEDTRRQIDWNPEWSRRARAFTVYAALRTLGRHGIGQLVDRCCDHATALVTGLGALPGAEVLAWPQINQGLVRFLAEDGAHDARTDAVADAVQHSGSAWFGTTTWRGMRAMRISVCNWRTTGADVASGIAAVARALEEC